MVQDVVSSTHDAAAPPRVEPIKLVNHLIIAIAIALIAPFTILAWPFAILTGIVIGKADADKQRGEASSAATGILRVLAVTGGVLAMLFFGALIGGVIGFGIVVLAATSERAAALAAPTDRIVARLLLFIVPVLLFVGFLAAGANFSIRIGSPSG